MKDRIPCILCGSEAVFFQHTRKRHYYQCTHCRSVLLDPDDYISAGEEKERYEKHNNDVHDPRYQKFVWPVAQKILENHTAEEHGLDYGAGTGPVITKLLRDRDYRINTWDPFFDDDRQLLESTYHYMVCCEVVEHFHRPLQEFHRLRRLLKPGGSLYCMTQLYDEGMDFKRWNYKNDETHVIFYHKNALDWIARQAGFSGLSVSDGKLIVLQG